MSARMCTTMGHEDRLAEWEAFVYDEARQLDDWFPYCAVCALAFRQDGEDVRPTYPNWTLARMGDIFREAGKMMARYNAAPQNDPPDMDFYRQQMRVLYDLLHEDGR